MLRPLHLLVSAGLLLTAGPAFAGPDDGPSVQVTAGPDGTYTVKGAFMAPVSEAGAWRVLTDYAHMGAFIPAMRSSVVSRAGRSALIDQATTSWFLSFSKTTHVRLRIEETPFARIDFTDVSHRDFEVYRGAWLLEARPGETRVAYEASAKPRFMPPAIGASVMTETVRALLSDLKAEVLRRRS